MPMLRNSSYRYVATAVLLAGSAFAYEDARSPGTAVVVVEDREYTLPIECNDPADAGKGFSTEPSRITRERTGRSSAVRINVRPWKETDELVVSLDRYVAWVPKSVFKGSPVDARIDMSPASVVRNNMPVTMTYDIWTSGDRPEGLTGVQVRVDCAVRDPEAPSSRSL